MNRLVIIGNGFDLAHGLPTKFSDFFLAHLKDLIIEFQEKGTLRLHDYLSLEQFHESPFGERYPSLENKDITNISSPYELIVAINRTDYRLRAFSLFNSILPQNIDNWVDIERVYFNQLRKAANNTNDSETNLSEVNKLNDSLKVFMKYFEMYLGNAVVPLINSKIKIEEFNNIFNRPGRDTYVLNFNYTNIIELYNNFTVNRNVTNIHGQVGGNIVFGYGDEHNEHYKLFENFQENHFLEFSKSSWYTIDQNYRRLLGFMGKNFEVYVIGHSCGLSDRTLLKSIFENQYCRRITLFHRGNIESHRSLVINLSRHFDDKNEMRQKVVPYQSANRCPQYDD